jgi:hypothetical protein
VKDLRELESPENLGVERRSWRTERFGWLALFLLIGAALAGLLGPGPLSSLDARTPEGELAISYPRFMRMHAPAAIRIRSREVGAREARIWLSEPWLQGVRVLGIAPPPMRSELTDGRRTLVFATSKGSAASTLQVTLDVEPRSAGSLRGAVGLESGPELHFHQLVYP